MFIYRNQNWLLQKSNCPLAITKPLFTSDSEETVSFELDVCGNPGTTAYTSV